MRRQPNMTNATLLTMAAVMFVSMIRSVAQADVGPKPDDRQYFSVTKNGKPLPEPTFLAALLEFKQEFADRPRNMSAEVPRLYEALPPNSPQENWTYAFYLWGGKGRNGKVRFHGFRVGLPKEFRFAIFLPTEDRIYISNVIESHPLLHYYHVDLRNDGTAVLSRDESGLWLADGVMGLWHRGFFFALALTLALELCFLFLLIRILKRQDVLRRMLLIGLIVNLVTLPGLWCVSVVFFWMFGLWIGIVALAALEVGVCTFEGIAYGLFGKLGWRTALFTACAANAVSFFIGLAVNTI